MQTVSNPAADNDFDDKTVDLNAEFGQSINGAVGQHPFASMQENPDAQKRSHPRSDVELRHIEQKKRLHYYFSFTCFVLNVGWCMYM